MPKLTIDGKEIEVAEGTSVMRACDALGIEIPRFCSHEKLSVAGSCRMCLVEIEKMPKPVPSCAMPCADGMVVHTKTKAVAKARRSVLEMTLLNHPLDCPVCDQGGECDLQDIAFAYGRDRCRTKEARRQVRDKELGPLVKTVMNRCIHCTRCLRFMDEIAGSNELGGLFRGEKMEIAPAYDGPLTSELSGNVIDVCPVGALTSKPFAFRARNWEMRKTDSVDVLDAVGCSIRIDSRGGQVMRIAPRRNEAVNEVWINDKTRFACDGLSVRRLRQPMIRTDGLFRPAEWEEAFELVAARLKKAQPYRVAALAGDLADCESLFALGALMDQIDSPHRDCRQDGAQYDVSQRCAYVMNSGISGIEKADAVLLIGTNPRHEATLVNARIFKRWRAGGCSIGLIGAEVSLGYPYEHVGHSPVVARDLLEGKNAFARVLEKASNPMLIVGAGALARPDGPALHSLAQEIAEKFGMLREDWNGFNVLQLAASRVGGLDLGFLPVGSYGKGARAIVDSACQNDLEVLYLMGADEIRIKKTERTFIVYQGHHADRGAELADVVFPGCAYTEKEALYVNTEGRPQTARRAVAPTEEAKEDWRIVAGLSEAVGRSLPFDTLESLRAKMFAKHPVLAKVGEVVPSQWKKFGASGTVSLQPFEPAIENFYGTDPISRASPTMAACSSEILPLLGRGGRR